MMFFLFLYLQIIYAVEPQLKNLNFSFQHYNQLYNLHDMFQENTSKLNKKIFYIKDITNEDTDTTEKPQENISILCKNKYCSCTELITIYDKFKKKCIFSHIEHILKEELEKLNKNTTNKGLCGFDYNEKNEKIINYIDNFIKLLQRKTQEDFYNTLYFLCSLSNENLGLFKRIGDILLNFMEKINKKNSLFNFTGLIQKNPIILINKDPIDIINFIDSIYDKVKEINNNSKNKFNLKDEISYGKYKLLVMQYVISEEFNNDEKKDLIKNVIKIAKENEKNLCIHEKLEKFTKNIW